MLRISLLLPEYRLHRVVRGLGFRGLGFIPFHHKPLACQISMRRIPPNLRFACSILLITSMEERNKGFSRIRGIILEVSMMRIIIFGGLGVPLLWQTIIWVLGTTIDHKGLFTEYSLLCVLHIARTQLEVRGKTNFGALSN